jgi:hypothetical protein
MWRAFRRRGRYRELWSSFGLALCSRSCTWLMTLQLDGRPAAQCTSTPQFTQHLFDDNFLDADSFVPLTFSISPLNSPHNIRPNSHSHPSNFSLFWLPFFILVEWIGLHFPQPQSKTLILTLFIHDSTRIHLIAAQILYLSCIPT